MLARQLFGVAVRVVRDVGDAEVPAAGVLKVLLVDVDSPNESLLGVLYLGSILRHFRRVVFNCCCRFTAARQQMRVCGDVSDSIFETRFAVAGSDAIAAMSSRSSVLTCWRTHFAACTILCLCDSGRNVFLTLQQVAIVMTAASFDQNGTATLAHADVECLFHEFGHALAGLLRCVCCASVCPD